MKCPLCRSIVPEIYAKCADCGKETLEIEQGQTVYHSACSGKRRARRLAKALKPKTTKALRPTQDKAVKPVEDK